MTDKTSHNTNLVAFQAKCDGTNGTTHDQQIALFVKFLSDNFNKNDVSEMTITYRKKTGHSIEYSVKSLANDSDFWTNNALMVCAVAIVFGYIWVNSL